MRMITKGEAASYVSSCGGKVGDEVTVMGSDDVRWDKFFIQDSTGVQVGRITFRNGKPFAIKNYKKNCHREISDGDLIFFGLDKMVYGDGGNLSRGEFMRLWGVAQERVKEDLAERQAWRDANPRTKVNPATGKIKKRASLKGKNPRMFLWNMIVGSYERNNPKEHYSDNSVQETEGNTMTQIVKMNVNKIVAGNQIAEMIREHANSNSMPITIGIDEDGNIEKWHNVHGFSGMIVELYNTEGGYDDLGGIDPDDWDSEDEDACARFFEETWIQDGINNAIQDENYLEIIWPNN